MANYFLVTDVVAATNGPPAGVEPGNQTWGAGSAKVLEYETSGIKNYQGATMMTGSIIKIEAASEAEAKTAAAQISGGSNDKPVLVTEANWTV